MNENLILGILGALVLFFLIPSFADILQQKRHDRAMERARVDG